jgi:hypothetical protein
MTSSDSLKPLASRGLEPPDKRKKKADVVEHPEAFNHVGLLFNEPPGWAGLPFISSSDKSAACVHRKLM